MELSPSKPLEQSKNVTVGTFHIYPGGVHEHIFLGQKVPKNAKNAFFLISKVRQLSSYVEL